MDSKDIILSEYIDGELPPELKNEFEKLLLKDAALSSKYQHLKALKKGFAPASDEPDFQASQEKVWAQLEWATHKAQRSRFSLEPLWDFFRKPVSLPVPALAGFAVVFLVLGLFAFLRPNAPNTYSEPMDLSQISADHYLLNSDTVIPQAQSVSGGELPAHAQSSGYEVSFAVESLNQLLNILEGKERIQELRIQLPSMGELPEEGTLGEPVIRRLDNTGSTSGGTE